MLMDMLLGQLRLSILVPVRLGSNRDWTVQRLAGCFPAPESEVVPARCHQAKTQGFLSSLRLSVSLQQIAKRAARLAGMEGETLRRAFSTSQETEVESSRDSRDLGVASESSTRSTRGRNDSKWTAAGLLARLLATHAIMPKSKWSGSC